MNREDVRQECLRVLKTSPHLIIEAGTGYGKTKLSLDLVRQLCLKDPSRECRILLLVAKRVHKDTWSDEISKWGSFAGLPVKVLMECYESLHRHEEEYFDVVIADEVHHVGSDARLLSLSTLRFSHLIGLSATIPDNLRHWLRIHYNVGVVSVTTQEAIDGGVLPEPEIYLLPLQLDNRERGEVVAINPKARNPVIKDDYEMAWKYRKSGERADLRATQRQKLQWYNQEVDRRKRFYEKTRSEWAKHSWLNLCGERLKFLANAKNRVVLGILGKLAPFRTLTFCCSVQQAEILGTHCIHSKNGDKVNDQLLDEFNSGKIDHITACQILNEGVNLVNCQWGIFANVNSSDTIKVQRIGRLLRHRHPKIVIPYYSGTREEEIVNDMMGDYDPRFIRKVNDITDCL